MFVNNDLERLYSLFKSRFNITVVIKPYNNINAKNTIKYSKNDQNAVLIINNNPKN
jgi:hypothetical protein